MVFYATHKNMLLHFNGNTMQIVVHGEMRGACIF